MWFETLVFAAASAAAAIAAIAGFGVGSVLTPVFGLVAETKVAVAAVAIPHVVATAIRFWRLRAHVDLEALWRFGLPSAIGGLTGALLHGWASSPWLTVVFGGLLLFVAVSEISGLARRLAFHGTVAWLAGALSGLLGGLVGNQGGIRSAALLGFDLPKHAFVATATAAGLIVDAARLPVYLSVERDGLQPLVAAIAIATAGATIGTVYGHTLLSGIPEAKFRTIVALMLALLGTVMLGQGIADL